MNADIWFMWGALLLTGLAAWHDWRSGEIPNALTLGGLAAGVIGRALTAGLSGETGLWLVYGALGAGLCGLVPLVMHRIEMLGGGDVKLLAATGALLGPFAGIEAEFFAFTFGVIAVLVRLAWQGRLFATMGGSLLIAKNAFVPRAQRVAVPAELATQVRFAPYVFAATLVALALNWRL